MKIETSTLIFITLNHQNNNNLTIIPYIIFKYEPQQIAN
jgi:hypothetical protein